MAKDNRGSGGMNGNWIRAEKRISIYARDSFACVYCGRGFDGPRPLRVTGNVLSLDHLIPRSQGGKNEVSNLVTSCVSCNSSRQDKPWREYATGGAVERIEYLIQQPIDVEYGKWLVASLAGNPVEEER
jgi:hypothetical protein